MTELEQIADAAWAAAIRDESILTRAFGGEPMPAPIAVDMVQDVCGERDDAVVAIREAATRWLNALAPIVPWRLLTDAESVNAAEDAATLRALLAAGDLGSAEACRQFLVDRTDATRLAHAHYPRSASVAQAEFAARLGSWCFAAKRAIRICSAIKEVI